MKNIGLINLYLIFVKIGAILLGGGYVILPIVLSEFVDKRNLIEREVILDFFALSQSLPGIIAANISMFIGYKLRGKLGAIVAMFGIITAPFFIILILATILANIIDNTYIQASLWGIGISIIALILLTIREIWQNSNKDIFFYSIFIVALLSMILFNLSPIKTILMFVPLGIICKSLTSKKESEE